MSDDVGTVLWIVGWAHVFALLAIAEAIRKVASAIRAQTEEKAK